jgi:antitoxin component of RelBE/YafQ-DinJ toxin-antitoxin module
MRTTLTIDDQVAMSLKEIAHRRGRPFKEVVNEALRKGVHALERPESQPYRLSPASLGPARPHMDLEKARNLAHVLEDAAIAMKLELRK